MKVQPTLRLACSALLCLLLSACQSAADGIAAGVDDALNPEDPLPSAALLGVQVTRVDDTVLEFTTDLLVLDADATPVPLVAEQVSIAPLASQVRSIEFERTDFSLQQQSFAGAYSALLMLDQSASMGLTDVADTRLVAAAAFIGELGAGDEVGLAAFAPGGSLPQEPVTFYAEQGQRYTGAATAFPFELAGLAESEAGTRPLFDALAAGIDDVSRLGLRDNRALLLLTDGDDNASQTSLEQAIAAARDEQVRVYTVGLTGSVATAALARMASQTGGAHAELDDPAQLISLYRGLGRYTSGQASFYRVGWRATSDLAFQPAAGFTAVISVDNADRTERVSVQIDP